MNFVQISRSLRSFFAGSDISRLLKNDFSTTFSCKNPNDFEGQFFKTWPFQHPVSHSVCHGCSLIHADSTGIVGRKCGLASRTTKGSPVLTHFPRRGSRDNIKHDRILYCRVTGSPRKRRSASRGGPRKGVSPSRGLGDRRCGTSRVKRVAPRGEHRTSNSESTVFRPLGCLCLLL